MTIAIFGGSFNPVHLGHFEIVQQANRQFHFTKIIIVPAYKNPLKEQLPAVPEEIRLKMLEATFAEIKNVEISLHELRQGKTCYTYTTLEHFRELHPEHRLFLLLGQDALSSFHLWVNADKITELCSLIAFYRPSCEQPVNHLSSRLQQDIIWSQACIPDISATEIRNTNLDIVKKSGWIHPSAFKIWETFITSWHVNTGNK